LAALGEANPLVVGLDADVKNSTFTDKFGKQFPDRFFEHFIAEQTMVGAAVGLAACGKIPFAATYSLSGCETAASECGRVRPRRVRCPINLDLCGGG
jgi:transketolase C-terminal domain/subunit